MAFSVNDFAAELLKDVQLDESSKNVLIQTLANPAVSKRLEESTLRQSDYSRVQDEYKKKLAAAQDYWDGLVSWEKTRKTELETKEQQMNQKLGHAGVTLEKAGTEVTEQQLQELAKQSIAYQNAITKLSMQYLKDFNEVLDPEELLKIAARDQVNVNIAFERYTQPKREAIQKTEFEKALVTARNEGKLEAEKNFKMPTTEQPFSPNGGNPHSLDNLGSPKEKAAQFGVMAAVEAYTKDFRAGKAASF